MQNKVFAENHEKNLKNTQKTLENGDFCMKCGTSEQEILETGFVGCEKCYELPAIKTAVDKLFGGKRHKMS